MTKMEVEIIGYVLLAILALISWLVFHENQKKLYDPNDNSVIFLNDLLRISQLSKIGLYEVIIYRQSGGDYKEPKIFKFSHEALAEVLSTFKKAKIECVKVISNSESELSAIRLYHNHRGRNEGKKVGGFNIRLVHGQTMDSRLRIMLSQEFTAEELNFIKINENNGKYSYSTGSKEIAQRLSKMSGNEIKESKA